MTERERDRRLIIKNCVELMVTTRDRHVYIEVCDILRRMGGLTDDEFCRLLKAWRN